MDTNGSPNLGKRTSHSICQYEKKRTDSKVNFSAPADKRVKLKESEKRDKYIDLARGQEINGELN